MFRRRAWLCWGIALGLSFSSMYGQNPQQIIQQVVDAELAADQNDHSKWLYLEETEKPKEHIIQWVAGTEKGDIDRILQKNGESLPESQQRDLIDKFLHDPKAQDKQISENEHDVRQIDDLLKLLPVAFVWTKTDATETTTSLHFEPAPNFRPPTREARVFSGMSGDLVVDDQQHRVCNIKGHLTRDITFGGGLLGRLKKGSSFYLKQDQVGPSLWQLTAIQVHLQGSALLFKSVSLQEDDTRSRFHLQPLSTTLDEAAAGVMKEPDLGLLQEPR